MYNLIVFERDSAPETILQLLNRSEKRSTSWAICEKNFAPVLKKLRDTPPPRTPEAGLIYSSSGKYVWKLSMIKRNQDKTIVFADSHTANGSMTDGTHISSGSKRRHPNGFNANFFDGSARNLMENYQVTADQQLYVWNVTSNDELMTFRN